MATILVTGGAGFIGAHLSRELLDRGHEVVVLDDLSGGFRDNIDARARFVEGSIVDVSFVERVFVEGHFDYVFHLAAYAAEGLSHFIRRYNYMNNLIGSVNLINQSVLHQVKRFVFTSSVAVYGNGELPLCESQIPHPEDPYGIAKFAVEQDLRSAHSMFGLDYTIFRPHNVYGEYQNIGDRYRNVVGIFMNQIMLGQSLTIFGDGLQTRAFSYIGDTIPSIAKSIELSKACNEVFNIGGDNVYTVQQLAEVVLQITRACNEIRHLPPRNEALHVYSDHSKYQEVFGPQVNTLLEAGVERMWRWAERVGARKTKKFTEIEIERNLPDVWSDN